MHARLSVSAVSSWRWTLEEDLAFWQAAGVDRVGLSLRKLEATGVETAVGRVVDAGVAVTDILELGAFDLRDQRDWGRQRERMLLAVDVATAVGGCLVLLSGRADGMPWDEARAALAEALDPVRSAADAANVWIALENTGSLRLDLSFVTTLADAVDLAADLGVGVCMETSACWAERALHETVASAASAIELVQVSDVAVGSLTTPDRRVPGDGDVPLRRILGWLLDASYAGPFSLELVGPRIEEEGYAAAIRRGVAALDALLESITGSRSS